MGTELTSDDQSGTNDNFLISRLLEQGIYYIEVSSSGTETGNYDLRVDTDDVDVDNHGNTIATATTLTLTVDTSVSGRIDPADDVDYFRIDISTSIFVDIFTTGGLNTVGRLINSVGTELTSDDQSGTNDNFLIRRLLERGTYYIEVSGSGTETGNYDLRVDTVGVDDVAPQISLIIPSTLAESTNEIDGITMIDVKHGEPFPVYISVDAFADIPDSLLLTLDGPQDGALPPTLMTSALGAGATWSELFVGNSTTTAVGQQNYRYCLAGTQNCSSTISVSYSPPAEPIVDVDEISPEWDFTSSDQTATPAGCPPNAEGTLPTLLSQEGNTFTSRSFLTYTGIVDGDSYSLAYRNPNVNGGTYIDTHTTQYSPDPVALSGPGVWWWTDRAGFLCRGTYNIIYTPRPRIDSIAVADMSVSEDVGNVAVTVTLTHSPVQPVVATLEIEGTATDADYQVERNINFGVGERQTTFNLDIVDDNLVEPNETIILNAVSQDLTLVGASSTTLTIEDNDVTATTLTLNRPVSGTIDSAGDVGYFSIVISTTTFVTIYTTGDDLEDTIGTLQNSAGTELAANDDPPGTSANHFLIRARLNPGTYYIRVMGFASDTGNYSIQVDVDSVDDHSDIRFTATEIELSTPVSGRIDPGGDADYFSLEILEMDAPADVNIFTTGDELDTAGRLIDSVGTEVDSDNQLGDEDHFLISTRLNQGTYYIEVTGVDHDGTGDYVLHVDIDDVDVDDHGDTIETATTLTLDTSVSGTIDPADDADYFSLRIDTATDVNIFTTGDDLDTIGNLLRRTNTPIQSDDQSGTGDNFLISVRLEQGTYYIRVGSFNSNSTGNYTLYVLTDDHSPTTETATIVSLDTSEPGRIDSAGEIDYFSLEIREMDAPADVNIFTTGNLNTVGRLINSVGTQVDFDDQSGEGDNFLIRRLLEQGTYYIEVSSSGTKTGGYELHVDVDVSPIAGLEIVGFVGDDIRLEEGANVTLRVTLDRAFDQDVTIQIETAGTATQGEDEDYTITVNPVTLPIGSTSVNTRLMIIRDGDNQEPDETIILTLNADNEQIRDGEPGARLTLTIGARALLFRIKVFLEGAR